MRDSKQKSLYLGTLGVIFALVGLTVGHYYGPTAEGSPEDDEIDESQRFFMNKNVVTGPILEDDVSESWPWAHHVDFDERYPGEDQIAEESRGNEHQQNTEIPQQSRPQGNDRFPATDDLVVPDFARMFSEGPQIGSPTSQPSNEYLRPSPFSRPLNPLNLLNNLNADHPWWDLFGRLSGVWWRGANVCVKREEVETEKGDDDSDESPSVQFSMCSQQNTRFVCTTRHQNPETKKLETIRSEYECCQGFALDEGRTQCVRGGHQDILTTIEQIGGTEFVRLIRMAGLESKLKTQNLTVFVPSNEALVKYIREHHLDSNPIEFIPQAPASESLFRERRSILMHTRNEAGGRNVRRRGGETKGRRAMMTMDDQYPTDLSSSSEEDREQETRDDDVVRVPIVKRKDPSLRRNVIPDEQNNNYGPSYGMEGVGKGELEQMLLNQMLAGKLSTDDFIDEKVVFTENVNEQANEIEALDLERQHRNRNSNREVASQGSVLRLNTWFLNPMGPLYTVNCVPLTSLDNKCSNGMVHIVTDVFQPATQSIGELLANNPQLSVFRSYLHAAGLLSMLEKSDGQLTLLAPTNEALEKMDPSILSRMRVGDSCLKKIMRRHILPITLCSVIIQKDAGSVKVRNMDLDILEIQIDNNGKTFINGSEFIRTDSIATNGVLHVIDKVIVSDNDKKLSEILVQDGHEIFVGLLHRAGIKLNDMENVTVFVPSGQGMRGNLERMIMMDPARLREHLMYHITRPEMSKCALTEKTTLQSVLPGRSLEVNPVTVPLWPLVASFPTGRTTVQCAKIEEKGGRGCNGVYHEIDRFLVPPISSVFGIIQTSPKFSIFTRLLKETLDETSLDLLSSGNGTVLTVFAPTDEAFSAIGKSDVQKLMNDKPYAMKVINRHIFRDAVCCSEVYPEHNLFFRMLTTLNGSVVPSPISRNSDESVRFGRGKVESCDLMGLNGIVQTVDTVSIDEVGIERKCRNCNPLQSQFQFFNFGR